MNDKRKLSPVLIWISGILTVASAALLIRLLIKENVSFVHVVEIVSDIVASAVAFFYICRGYTKEYAEEYKTCMLIAAINALAVAVIATTEKTSIISLVMCIIAFGDIVILAFGKDLGKKKSTICCIVLVLIRLAGFIASFIPSDGGAILNPARTLIIAQIALAILISLVTYAKYLDKDARGTT